MVYKVSSRTSRTTQRNPVLEKQGEGIGLIRLAGSGVPEKGKSFEM